MTTKRCRTELSPDATDESLVCRESPKVILPPSKEDFLRIASDESIPLYVYTRTDECRKKQDAGEKDVDPEFKFHKVVVTDYKNGPYRYSCVVVSGEECNYSDLNPSRVFARVNKELARLFENCNPKFDDDLARSKLLTSRSYFTDPEDQNMIDLMRPVFGFIDEGFCIARSAQGICVNPLLTKCDWWDRK